MMQAWKLNLGLLAVVLLVAASTARTQDVQPPAADEPIVDMMTDKQKLSYSLGYMLGQRLGSRNDQFDAEMVAQGLEDAMTQNPAMLTAEQRRTAMEAYQPGPEPEPSSQAPLRREQTGVMTQPPVRTGGTAVEITRDPVYNRDGRLDTQVRDDKVDYAVPATRMNTAEVDYEGSVTTPTPEQDGGRVDQRAP